MVAQMGAKRFPVATEAVFCVGCAASNLICHPSRWADLPR
jgi:hypothetical protein